MSKRAVIFGASRGVGYFTALYLLQASWSVTLLLRNPEGISSDAKFEAYLQSGTLKLVKGDATVEADVRAAVGDKVDLLVTSIGAYPKITWGGIRLQGRPDLTTAAAAVLVKVLKDISPKPRVIAVSTMGLGENHHCMPLLHRLLYPTFLYHAHIDKEGMENLILRAGANTTTPVDHFPPHILPQTTIDASPENILEEVIIVRPALLLDGDEPRPELPKVGENVKVWSLKRSEVGRFIVNECLPGDQRWVNKSPVVGY